MEKKQIFIGIAAFFASFLLVTAVQNIFKKTPKLTPEEIAQDACFEEMLTLGEDGELSEKCEQIIGGNEDF